VPVIKQNDFGDLLMPVILPWVIRLWQTKVWYIRIIVAIFQVALM